MKVGLTADSIEILVDIINDATFTSYTGYDVGGTASTIDVSVRTSPYMGRDNQTVVVYLKPVATDFPIHTIGDFQRKFEEHFWVYVSGTKKATVSNVVETLTNYLNSVRKDTARSGNQADLRFIDVMGERDASDPTASPHKFTKILEIRTYWWVGMP